jgi:branched-chain amino acid transport system ATP-binding protein
LARFILRIKHELGITMIWIEHDLEMVADLADRIHVLDYGRTLAEGQPSTVLKDPRVIAAYIGTSALTTVRQLLTPAAAAICGSLSPWSSSASGR